MKLIVYLTFEPKNEKKVFNFVVNIIDNNINILLRQSKSKLNRTIVIYEKLQKKLLDEKSKLKTEFDKKIERKNQETKQFSSVIIEKSGIF